MPTPSYLELHRKGELRRRVERAREIRVEDGCHLCPRGCGVDHASGARGVCGIPGKAVVASAGPHFGEEPCLVGDGGSGTIFFAGCNLHCVFCQNHDISEDPDAWREVGPPELAALMLSLQARKVENLNLVTPAHVAPDVLEALDLAAGAGLVLPLVYNTSGYDGLEVLRLFDGVVDIYMPDFKFWDPEVARELAGAPDYPEVARRGIREMHRQVGDLVLDGRGVAVRGLLVRHLVLPGRLAGSAHIIRFLAEQVSANTCVNVMDQYHPDHLAYGKPPLDRYVTREEYLEVRRMAEEAGLRMVEDLVA